MSNQPLFQQNTAVIKLAQVQPISQINTQSNRGIDGLIATSLPIAVVIFGGVLTTF